MAKLVWVNEHSPYWKERAKCSRQKLIVFFRQLSVLVGSGVPIIDALQVTVEHDDDATLPLVAESLQKHLDAGKALSQAAAEFPRIFSPLSVAFLRIGEENGSLVAQLDQLSVWMERDQRMRRKVLGALVYPVCAVSLTVVLTLALFLTVIPGFMEMFREMDVELPWPTKILAIATSFITSPLAWAGAMFLLTALFLSSKSFVTSSTGRLVVYRFFLSTPVVGPLLRYSSVARFSFSIASMLRSGCNYLLSLRLATGVAGSPLLEHRMNEMLQMISEGGSLSEFMEANEVLFPRVVTNLVGVAEKSAKLPKIFSILASHYEEEVENQVQLVATLLEPILMGLVAAIVGFVVIAVFLPMYGFLDKL